MLWVWTFTAHNTPLCKVQQYCTASHASCSATIFVLPDFHKLVKIKYCLQGCTVGLPIVSCVSNSVLLPASREVHVPDCQRGNGCATNCFDVRPNLCLCFIAVDPRYHKQWTTTPVSQHACLQYQWCLAVQHATSPTGNPGPQFKFRKFFNKICLSEQIK